MVAGITELIAALLVVVTPALVVSAVIRARRAAAAHRSRPARAPLTATAVSVMTLATACAPGSASPSTPAPSEASGPSVTAAPVRFTGRPDHVVVVMLENKDEADIALEAPYLHSLAATGVDFTDMHGETHPSQPNYLALFSGDTQGIDDNSCPHTLASDNLATQLTSAGYSFIGYSEDLPEPGYTGCGTGDYARKHSPWTNFSTVPAIQNQPLSAMPSNYADLPTVSFVIPNMCHDMHDCFIAEGDAWLRNNIDDYARWAGTHDSLLVVSFDESESTGDDDNHIATLAVGEHVVPGAFTEYADHYRLLRTLEDLYGLPPLGHAADTTAIPALWNPSA